MPTKAKNTKKYSIKQLYFSFIHSYLNYCNIAWGSTNKTYLSRIHKKQKHACRLILNVNKLTPSKPLFQELQILSIYQLNICQNLIFMFKEKENSNPSYFSSIFKISHNKYHTRFSNVNFKTKTRKSKQTSFRVSHRGHHLWSKVAKDDLNFLRHFLFSNLN